jgi:hypothetical protein
VHRAAAASRAAARLQRIHRDTADLRQRVDAARRRADERLARSAIRLERSRQALSSSHPRGTSTPA